MLDQLLQRNICPVNMSTYLDSMITLLHVMIRCKYKGLIKSNHVWLNVCSACNAGEPKDLNLSFRQCEWLSSTRESRNDPSSAMAKLSQSIARPVLARFVASFQVFETLGSGARLLTTHILDGYKALQPDLGCACLEALSLSRQDLDIEALLLIVQLGADLAQSSAQNVQFLDHLATLLCKVESAELEVMEEHEHQRLTSSAWQLLASPVFALSQSPSIAQSALRAKGGILSLLCTCQSLKPDHGLDAQIAMWSQSLRLWLDESSVSHFALRQPRSLTENCRTSQPD